MLRLRPDAVLFLDFLFVSYVHLFSGLNVNANTLQTIYVRQLIMSAGHAFNLQDLCGDATTHWRRKKTKTVSNRCSNSECTFCHLNYHHADQFGHALRINILLFVLLFSLVRERDVSGRILDTLWKHLHFRRHKINNWKCTENDLCDRNKYASHWIGLSVQLST